MKIPLNEISTAGLFKLLRDVSAELEARMSAPVYHALPLAPSQQPRSTRSIWPSAAGAHAVA